MKIFSLLCIFFFEILPKFNDFVNIHNCIGIFNSTNITLRPIFIKNKIEINKKKS